MEELKELKGLSEPEKISFMTLRYMSSKYFIIPTKSIIELQTKLMTWLKINTTGGIIWGQARVGKSTAINYITSALQKKYGKNFPVVIWTITDHADTERTFYSSILKAMGIKVSEHKTAFFLKEQVLNALNVLACETPFRRVVLFIDEAWQLMKKDFSWLMDLYNVLSLKDIHLACFLFGTHELKNMKDILKISGQEQIVGRFMVHESRYFGIRTEKELGMCLLALDKENAINANGTTSTTKLIDFYFPHHDEKTFYALTHTYWEVFQKARSSYNIQTEDIPMKYFMDSFKILLDLYGDIGDLPVAFPTFDEIDYAIELSGYGESDDQANKKAR